MILAMEISVANASYSSITITRQLEIVSISGFSTYIVTGREDVIGGNEATQTVRLRP